MKNLLYTVVVVIIGFIAISDTSLYLDFKTLNDQKKIATEHGPNFMDYYGVLETMDHSDIRFTIIPRSIKNEYHELRTEVFEMLSHRFETDEDDMNHEDEQSNKSK